MIYTYQLIGTPEDIPPANVVKRSDGVYVPIEGDEYTAWLAEGNTPDPVDPQFYWDQLRAKRDRLLAETDWVTLKATDASIDGLGIQLPTVWMDYRQALRDLPANTTDPENPVWPTKPH